MSLPEYPYLPEGRSFKFVPVTNPFMVAASEMRLGGDPLFPIGAVLVKDGQIIGTGANGYNKGPNQSPHICPRVVLDCPSGTGYELCSLHGHEGHSERMVLQDAVQKGHNTVGADLYMYGHWWACKPCWDALIEAGIRDVYLLENAHIEFSREKVQSEQFQSSVKRAYIAGAISNVPDGSVSDQRALYESLAIVAEGMGIIARVPHVHNSENKKDNHQKDPRKVFEWGSNEVKEADVIVADVTLPSLGTGGEILLAGELKKPVVLLSQEGAYVSKFVTGNPAVVYHAEYSDRMDAARKLRNILKQL